ncbi:UNVERIFIED_CONTAM: hypothetical protein GTU68_049685 [Idotea baltica]|nr:hypothetical protein [Idotea baltica]
MFEAQAIAIELENIPPSRPLTHDLFRNVLKELGVNLVEVIINNLKEGVFFAQLICEHDGETLVIDSRTSDALALAVRFNSPIYTNASIMDEAGIILDEALADEQQEFKSKKNQPKKAISKSKEKSSDKISTAKLKEMLDAALQDEDYEKAASIRDELKKRS